MDHVSRFEIAAGSDDSITNRTAADALALLVYLGAALRVDGAVCAHALIESPMSSSNHSVRVLLGDVADYKAQGRLSDCCLCGHGGHVLSGLDSMARDESDKGVCSPRTWMAPRRVSGSPTTSLFSHELKQ